MTDPSRPLACIPLRPALRDWLGREAPALRDAALRRMQAAQDEMAWAREFPPESTEYAEIIAAAARMEREADDLWQASERWGA